MSQIQDIQNNIRPIREQLINHDLYKYIETPDDLRIFTQYHVFAVWDVMSLAKALQQKLTCVKVPWVPKNSAKYSYLINEIVLAETSGINRSGYRQSHFEMYLDIMDDIGASTSEISDFIEHVRHGTDIFLVISTSDLPKAVKSFLIFTFNTIYNEQTPEILSLFTFGREDLIPDVFSELINDIQKKFPKENIKNFKHYFQNRKEIDSEKHLSMSLQLVDNICNQDKVKWESVQRIAEKSLIKRLELCDDILKTILNFKAIA